MMPFFKNKKLINSLKILRPLSRLVLVVFSNFEMELEQNRMRIKPLNYVSVSIFISTIQALLVGVLLGIFFYEFGNLTTNNIMIIIGISVSVLLFSIFYFMKIPELRLNKRAEEIDKSLLFALRHILIKVRSGIPLFDSMVGIAYGDYGLISEEFQKAVKDIEGGTPQVRALEKLSFYNPSKYFRKFILQLTNSLRAGSDIARTLEIVVEDLENHKYLQVKEFGSRLSPISLMYIMLTIVIPSLGTTFLAVFAIFMGGEIDEVMFYAAPVIVIFANLFFMNIIQKTRPVFQE